MSGILSGDLKGLERAEEGSIRRRLIGGEGEEGIDLAGCSLNCEVFTSSPSLSANVQRYSVAPRLA